MQYHFLCEAVAVAVTPPAFYTNLLEGWGAFLVFELNCAKNCILAELSIYPW